MKRTGILLIVLAAFIFFVSEGRAEIKEKAFSVTPFIGGFTFDGVQSLTTRPVYGLRAGYDLTPKWAFEGVLDYVRTEPSGANDRVHVYNYRLEALYNFMAEKKLMPFLAAGIGGQSIDAPAGIRKGSNAVIDYGAGIKYFLTENLALRGDIRHILVFDNDTLNNLEYAIGLSYFWGGEKTKEEKPPVEAEAEPVVVLDGDKDSVPDDADECVGTPIGVKVDKYGCPLDTDADGVADYLDKCPDTLVMAKVDKYGCPLDTDADSVADYLDKCPNTPAGVKVDKNGCPLDTDGDGVPDYLDKCADTPKGLKVDREGCLVDTDLVDTDADGVVDYLDKCPNTPKGVKVDREGCTFEVIKKAPEAAVDVGKVMIEKGRVTLKIEFDSNKAIVKSKYFDNIKRIAEVMKQHPDINVAIEGHTDNRGSEKANLKLSSKRADAVKAKLITMGIDSARIKAIGYGPSKPIASNAKASGRKLNRRVEAAVDYETKK
jgi:OOP family OmpA-OmpF porin